MNKKAQIGKLQGIVVVLVVVGVLLGIGFLIFANFIDNMDDLTATVTNESFAPVTAGDNVASVTENCFNTFAVTSAYNYSAGAAERLLIGTGNYTYDAETGIIYNLTSTYPTLWNVSYTYEYGSTGCGGVEDTVTGINVIPSWLDTLVLLAVVGVLLYIVFAVLPGAGGGRSSVAEV